MDLPSALHMLASNPALFAGRASGKVITMTPALVLFHWSGGEFRPWKPCFKDIVAQDWVAGTKEQLQKIFAQSAEVAA